MNHTCYDGQYFRTCMYVASCMGITHVMSEADWEGGMAAHLAYVIFKVAIKIEIIAYV